MIAQCEADIASLEEKLKELQEPTPTFKIGDVVEILQRKCYDGLTFLIVGCDNFIRLIVLESSSGMFPAGHVWGPNKEVKVVNHNQITQKELQKFYSCVTFRKVASWQI